MCRIMEDLQKAIKHIENTHKIKLTDKEIDELKMLLCSYVCDGHCRTVYHRILQ